MIYICVLNYNNSKDTIECLNSLKKLKDVSYRIVLVDNSSTDRSYEILEKYVVENPSIILIKSIRNGGYAAGNNIALKYALRQKDMDYCWILNNDTIVDENSLKYLKVYMDNHTEVGLCGSKLVYEWNRNLLQGYGGFYNRYLATTSMCKDINQIKNIDYVIGASCMVSRKFLESVGLMNEKYFLYFEELDWAYRSRGKFKIACVEESVVYHKEGATIGGNSMNNMEKSLLSDYYSLRNRLLFCKLYTPCFLPFVYIGLIGAMINRIKRGQFSRCLMIMKIIIGSRDRKIEE